MSKRKTGSPSEGSNYSKISIRNLFRKEPKEYNLLYDTEGCLITHEFLHSEDKLFRCNIDNCNNEYIQKINLQKHQLSAHAFEDMPLIECSEESCDYKTKSKLKLSNHMRVHKEFFCQFCNKCFKRKITLRKHESTHTGEKDWMFHCEWNGCDKHFKYRGEMIQHMNIHTEKLIHSCVWPNCDKTFTNKHTFYIHMRHHKGLDYKCKYTGCEYQTTNNIRFEYHLKRHQN